MSEKGTKKAKGIFRVENTRMIFRNFTGRENDYNEEGNRNFGLIISEEDAIRLKKDGWNVKTLAPRADDPDGFEQPWLPVKVKFGAYPPSVYLISPNNGTPKKHQLDEETIGQLDWANVEFVDAEISPYNYPARGKHPAGVSAYLRRLYVTIREDDLDAKYGSIPDVDDLEDFEEE